LGAVAVAEIRWTTEASSNLQGIFEYIAEDSPDAAQRVVQGIWDRAQSLETFPERGFTHRARKGRMVRIVMYGHYRIVYRLVGGSAEILGVYHGAMDLDRILGAPS